MNIRAMTTTTVAAALALSTAAFAGSESGTTVSPSTPADAVVTSGKVEGASDFTLPALDVACATPQLAVHESPVGAAIEGAAIGLRAAGVLASPRYNVQYRPRRGGSSSWGRRAPDAASVSQLHLGWYDQDGDPKPEFLIGVRGGPLLTPNFQLGAGVDWAHKSSTTSSITRRTIGPNGVPIEVREDLGETSSHYVPVYAFAQVQADDDMGIVPYFGGSLGYQLMFLHATDFQTGQDYDATFGGWGWQAWGGAAIPLSGRTRVTGEIFVNGAELNRDVNNDISGGTVRESVKADGYGARFGVAWGF